MKSWYDLNWREKVKIEEGEVNPLDYLSGYDFEVKVKVGEGKEQEEYESKTD